MIRMPAKYKARSIQEWDCDASYDGKRWIPARPVSDFTQPFWYRWKLAFLVLIGKCDAVDWEDD